MKCKTNTKNIDPRVVRTKNNKLLMQSTGSDCKIKKSQFVKKQDAKGLLGNLGISISFIKITLLNLLF